MLDDLIGLDIINTMTPARRDRFLDQLAGVPAPQHKLPAGLAPFRTLPPPEAPKFVRTRLAAAIAEAVAANGNVTRDELLSRGFTPADLELHFTAARRAARVSAMTI